MNSTSSPVKIPHMDLSSTSSFDFTDNISYVDQSTAASSGLISSSGGVAYMYSNSKDVQPNGRSSVRLESKDTYNEVLIIGDFTHIPAAYVQTQHY
jgi:hypothetical protein